MLTIHNVIDPEFQWLQRHASIRHSQNGEEGLFTAIFGCIGPKNKWCFECGAGDGITLSNTLALVEIGWRGVFVERNRRAFREMERRHTSPGAKRMGLDKRSIRVHAELEVVGPNSPEAILEAAGAPMDLDLFSLDIDGGEEDVIRFFDKLRPRVMCVEYVDGQYDLHLDAVLKALRESNYVPVAQTVCNVICTLPDLADKLRRIA